MQTVFATEHSRSCCRPPMLGLVTALFASQRGFSILRKLRDASEFSETGKLFDLSRLEEHLSWQAIQYLDPQTTITAQQFLQPSKLIRLDAKESYIRGLLSTSEAQKQQWLQQAARLDPQIPAARFQLGRIAFSHKDYRQAAEWFGKVPHG